MASRLATAAFKSKLVRRHAARASAKLRRRTPSFYFEKCRSWDSRRFLIFCGVSIVRKILYPAQKTDSGHQKLSQTCRKPSVIECASSAAHTASCTCCTCILVHPWDPRFRSQSVIYLDAPSSHAPAPSSRSPPQQFPNIHSPPPPHPPHVEECLSHAYPCFSHLIRSHALIPLPLRIILAR